MKGVATTRIKRPLILYVIVIAYVVAPLANIALLRAFAGIPLSLIIQRMIRGYGPLASIWLFTAPLVGIGFYFVHAVSWYVFVGHSGLILVDYAFKWVTRPSYYLGSVGGLYNMLMLTGNLLLVVVIGYVVQKHFRAPYFQALPRSWRESTRIPIHQWILVNGQSRRTTDMSEGGCFVADPGSDLRIGDRLSLRFHAGNLAIECNGEVMRQTQRGHGVRFMSLPSSDKREIKRTLKKRFPLRYEVDLACTWRCDGTARVGRVLNVSTGGCYVGTEVGDLTEGMPGEVIIHDFGQTLPAEVVWINSTSKYEKPIGFGCRFSRKHIGLVRILKRRCGQLVLTR